MWILKKKSLKIEIQRIKTLQGCIKVTNTILPITQTSCNPITQEYVSVRAAGRTSHQARAPPHWDGIQLAVWGAFFVTETPVSWQLAYWLEHSSLFSPAELPGDSHWMIQKISHSISHFMGSWNTGRLTGLQAAVLWAEQTAWWAELIASSRPLPS